MKGLLDVMGNGESDMPEFKRSGDNEQVEGALEDDTKQAGFEAAAQDAFHAVKSGDEAGFRDALQAAIEMSR